MFTQVLKNILPIAGFWLARDWFLAPIKCGDDDGCEELQKKVDTLKEKMGVKIPIKVAEHPAIPWAAHGCHCYGSAGITVPSYELNEKTQGSNDLQIAIIAHEISHIKHNDGRWLMTMTVLASAVATIFISLFCPLAYLAVADFCLAIPLLGVVSACSIRCERAADEEASKYLTDQQKLSLSCFFELIRIEHIAKRNDPNCSFITQVVRKCLISAEGDSLIGRFTHPSLKSRAEYFKNQLSPQLQKVYDGVILSHQKKNSQAVV